MDRISRGDQKTERPHGAPLPGQPSADQVLLAALLCLPVREEADPLSWRWRTSSSGREKKPGGLLLR